jgi:L-ascorbate metabolism protein UlaG (beta-lactamase superfamily)
MDLKGNRVTWLGHGTWLWETSDGKRVLVDPFLSSNPSCPEHLKDPGHLDTILVTHGHFDHIADWRDATKGGPTVVAIWEVGAYFLSQGVENVVQMNKGGTFAAPGVTVTMVDAVHSGGFTVEDGSHIEGGAPAGYVARFADGLCVYHAGDTDVMMDMQLIGEIDKPDVAVLPIGDHFTMGPSRAAHAVRLLGVKQVLCGHFATWPPLVGRPAELRDLVGPGVEVADLKPGDSL